MKASRVGLAGSALVFSLLTAPVLAQIPGSIFTVNEQAVPRSLFDHREDVFLAAGSPEAPVGIPERLCRFVDYLSDGSYYFQVTDAKGERLLSSDPVSERQVTVKGGVIFSYDGSTHATGEKTFCNSLSVSLMPYDDAGSRKAAYLVWITPVASFAGNPTDVGAVCGDGCFFGFRPELSRTFAFRVEDKRNCEPTFCVSGTKFEDKDGNGKRDSGEGGLPDVEIDAKGPGGVTLSAYSSSDGTYKVCGLTEGDRWDVSEIVPNGTKQTAPLNRRISKYLIARNFAYIVNPCNQSFTGVDFGNQLIPGAIGGLVFEDSNANGARDPGEPPLAGATVTLTPTSPPGSAQSSVSASNGTFLFESLAAGIYILAQTPPAGFTQTFPAADGYTVTLSAGGSSLHNDFGDFHGVLTGSLSGFVFNDANGNGVRDAGEVGMADVTVTLAPPPPGVTPTAVTAADGSFQFAGLPFGTYTLSETVPTGFKQTAPPPPGTITTTIDVAHPNITDLLFGNQTLLARIFGLVFVDTNGNGSQDAGEGPQSGVTVRLTSAGGQTATKVTGTDGTFSFDGVSAGTYTLSEVVPSGYVQTAPPPPGTFTVAVVDGDNKGPYVFGNNVAPAATASILGDKWIDVNENGVVDGGDYVFAGIVFVLTDSNGVQRTTTSGADGTYSFTNLPAGTYDLREVLPPNFVQTFPGTKTDPKGYTITVAPGEAKTGFRFLNKC